ncbi:cardiolipin synthase [Cupriavidus oxalaticus]|uniref:Cardiolipin synthase A n=1 Tax=Cupriavidus oxalaticus TaxID=96344 RepID=A0A375GQA8_9BURK|nr:cardiolipin synthase [Cupriavidus oxalaticus]QEZ42842.1 cardiolipin synthase [Cupriavidus oxalaticus]QRQ83550.1 cardiolipin synthase [Cupriavidus oxalaticus]QRQ92361.1 cardiolipin synthase [Cupriavidus oxalaticus]WQD86976.1 cardiolipin synthase [Cupriavidus oxalaticus]SPC24665.1 Cardiolipin synthase [Cupriavidus oxalaticus]
MLQSPSVIAVILLAFHVVGVVAALHAVMTVRTAPGAIAWAGSLLMMPYVTLVPYLIFGRSTFAGYVDARRFNDDRLREIRHGMTPREREARSACVVHEPTQVCMRALPRLTGMPCLANNDVRLLVNGTQTFDAIFAAIGQARQVLIVQFFIVHDDALGRRLQALLCERAQAGVKVYFLFDSIGCHALPRRYVRTLLEAGVDARPFSTHRGFVNRFQLNFRNHRKLVIVDGREAFIGGHNVGVEYLGERPPLAPWRDTHIALRGSAVLDLQMSFAEDWYWAAREVPHLLMPPPEVGGSMTCQVVPTGPADSQETCSLFFVEAIQSARHRLWITSPYFVPDEAVFAVLRLAVLRGVDVRILIPARPDHVVVYAASTIYAYQAVTAGIKLYRYQPGFLHQKVILIDDEAAAVGTANLDNRSFRLNFELMVMTADKGFAADVAAMLEADFANATRIGLDEFLGAPAPLRVAMHVAKLFAPIL